MPTTNPFPFAAVDAVWYVQMLGTFCASPVETDGGGDQSAPVSHFRTHKAALLLARLALFPERAHPRDELADLLWPEAPIDRAKAGLSQTLVYLRMALRQPRIGGIFLADHRTVRVVTGALQTDVQAWEAAARHALALGEETGALAAVRSGLDAFRGELLPGFYDDWVYNERHRLSELRDELHARLQSLLASPGGASHVTVTFPKEAIQDAATAVSTIPFVHAPLYLTRYFGRDRERAEVEGLLRQNPPNRLITLLGTGGIGKTRLAVVTTQALLSGARQDTAEFGWSAFVPLDSARNREQLEAIVLDVLGVHGQEAAGTSAIIKSFQARSALMVQGGRGRRVLLVLDNLEQLSQVVARFVTDVLSQVPNLTVLATSRQPVGIAGECEVWLRPLGEDTGAGTPEDVRLFCDRARLARPTFALTADNRATVEHLCGLLEGIPLALELAAGWMRVLTPEQIVSRLSRRFETLVSRRAATGVSGVAGRHESLRAAIAWSYELLTPDLQEFWVQLAVFRGGWTLEAAQTILGGDDANEPLLLLVERSLIVVEAEESTGQVRYRMLESLREFAESQIRLWSAERRTELQARHARYFEALARRANSLRTVKGHRVALSLLGAERDNSRAALRFTLMLEAGKDEQTARLGVRLACESAWLWSVREQMEYLGAAEVVATRFADADGLGLRAELLSTFGYTAVLAGDLPRAKEAFTESLAIWEVLGDTRESGRSRSGMGMLAWHTTLVDEAMEWFTDHLRHAREHGDIISEAKALNNLAICGVGRPERWEWVSRAVLLYRTHAPSSYLFAATLNSMGGIALENQDFVTAGECLEEAHTLAIAEGNHGTIGVAKLALVRLCLAQGEGLERGLELLQEAQLLFEELGEAPRVAGTLRLRFELALRKGDVDDAVRQARAHLRMLGELSSVTETERATARAEIGALLGEAGQERFAAVLDG